ncbi:MAG TPA: glycosyltransferase [Geminicoccus sp.]|uniref:glycosyltransferase n=1 Tax=Geminicoccus sp. TaxID=2024832 RepID=UPI002E35D134|nr:glycosyltransferase [Geminicoccus sp.]HEX2527556.1 glycosyltransferase [Geminicoccus sp.]
MSYDLIFFPDYRAANPYQRLLYDRLGPLHPQAGTIDDAIAMLDRAAPEQRVIFHLHWEDAIHRHIADPASAERVVSVFMARIDDFVARGGTLVWTMHNHGSHIGAHPALDRSLRRYLADTADRVHVHSLRAAAPVLRQLNVSPAKLIVLPHGNYLPIHDPRGIDQAISLAGRAWPKDRPSLLLFGRLDAYKGVLDLLDAFAAADADLRLVIAGKQIAPLEPDIQDLPPAMRERVTVLDGFIAEEDVGPLFAAVDGVVLPYRTIMTSGTLMLALSMDKPVIAPDLPAITDIVQDGREAILYPHGEQSALSQALARFAVLSEHERRRLADAARATGHLYDWEWIARQMGGALVEATSHGRAVRRPQRAMALSAGPG